MAATITFRPDEDDKDVLALIREHLTESIGKPAEADCIRFGLRAAKRELAGLPKPRHPKPHKS
jgi:hypothetical protein